MIVHRVVCSVLFLSSVLVGGCAGIDVVPLSPENGQPNGEAHGFRYYMPKPYLLVTELPPVTTTNKTLGNQKPDNHVSTPPVGGGETPPVGGGNQPGSGPAQASGGSNTDLGYSAIAANYVLKLIYLPDKSKPMALSMKPGLFGNVSLQPTFQDGWMLTNVTGNAVSDGSAALTAFASVVSALSSTAAKPTLSKDKDSLPVTGETITVTELNWDKALMPGLYEFAYNESDGSLKGLRLLTPFPLTNQCSGCPMPAKAPKRKS
jgi:hypothetical protein